MSKKTTLIGGLVTLVFFGFAATSFALSDDGLHVGSEAGDWFGQYVAVDSETDTNIYAAGGDLGLHVGAEAGNWFGQYVTSDSEADTNIYAAGGDFGLHVGAEAGDWYGEWLNPQEQALDGTSCPALTLTC